MKTPELKLKILQIVWSSDCYGYEIHKKLVSQGFRTDIGRLYRILNEMLTEGLVHYRWEKSEKGPEKRVYTIADKGRRELDKLLKDAIDIVHKFYSEYLMSLPRKTSVFEALARIAVPEPSGHSIIGFFAKEPSPIHEKILTSLRDRMPIDNIYAVKPREVNLNLNLENVVSLTGDYDDIPIRNKHISLLIISGLPSSQKLLTAAKEWHRVIAENGRLLLIAPTVLFSSRPEPLSIGDFIEKIEHQNEHLETAAGENLTKILEKLFEKVERRQMLETTLLTACNPRSAPQKIEANGDRSNQNL